MKPLRIATLAFRPTAQVRQRWQPIADYLNQTLPQFRFEIIPLRHAELSRAVRRQEVDFALTHPDDYIQLRTHTALTPIATLMPVAEGGPRSQFGGVIFTRADREDINTLFDLQDKTLIAPRANALGVYIAQQWTLRKDAGLEIDKVFSAQRFIGPPVDNTVRAILNSEADVGFVRTGVLESMAEHGTLALSDIKVINRQPASMFPLLLSTDLYPEWPLLALPHVSAQIGATIANQLQWMTRYDPGSAERIGYGFVPPMDYNPIESVLLALDLHPRSRERATAALTERFTRYAAITAAALCFGAILLIAYLKRLNATLLDANRKLRLHDRLLERLGDGVYCMSQDGQTQFMNLAAQQMLGFTQSEVLAKNSHALFHHHRKDGSPYPSDECPAYQTLQDGAPRLSEEWFIRKDGSLFPVELKASSITLDDSSCVAVVFRDISEQYALREEARFQRNLLQNVVDATPDLIFFKDGEGHYLGCNRAFGHFTGAHTDTIPGLTDYDLFDTQTADFFRRKDREMLAARKTRKNEEWVTYPDGRRALLETQKTPLRDTRGEIDGLVGISRDITQRKQAEEKVARMAFYDPLTQLPNRRMLVDRLENLLALCNRNQHYGALMMIDLDHFKEINDNEGHDAGDQVLVATSHRLLESIRTTDTAARLGGDEFVIVLAELGENAHQANQHASRVAATILERVGAPHRIGSHSYCTTPSIGIVLFSDDSLSTDQLLKHADQAMYNAKQRGRNRFQFAASNTPQAAQCQHSVNDQPPPHDEDTSPT
ncbi:diguanylate cyclase domain-containing protein [Motiliproteus sediminis]|uniref:diguanylate cyclase domain-containing protein n=1 Tax=Motiliproteus sediminis TaxID=1468178 RepID=UPI001AEF7C3D|nr:diguanylate cyclase [Motiliproteus sediminis]